MSLRGSAGNVYGSRNHSQRRRVAGSLCVLAAVGVLTSLGLSTTAQAKPKTPILLNAQCGEVLDQTRATYILQNDVGPCDSDGLVIDADRVVLDLNGHTVSGQPVEEGATGITGGVGEGNGIIAIGRSRVTIKNGTVRDFDAGVLLARNAEGTVATRNLLTGLTITNNVGNQEEASFPPAGPITEFSDGIVLLGAPRNVVEDNDVTENGGSGITLNDESNNNEIRNNRVADGRGSGIYLPAFANNNDVHHNNISGNPFGGISLAFNAVGNNFHHNALEGNGAGIVTSAQSDGNKFADNTVRNNLGRGIVISSRHNLVSENTVTGNGTAGQSDGITISGGALPPSTPLFGNTVRKNVVTGNSGNGIRITCTRDFAQPGGPCVEADQGNRIERNQVTGNGGAAAGTKLFAGGLLVGYFDLLDGSNHDNPGYPASAPECDNNRWHKNTSTTHYPDCTAG